MKPLKTILTPEFSVRLAKSEQDILAAQSLRYKVFVDEMGATGPLVNHQHKLEIDAFDSVAEQMILLDLARPEHDQVIGVYRMMDNAAAQAAGSFYTETEYDLSPLISTGRPMLELGRSCLHPDYRGGVGMLHLWQAIATEVKARGVEILFGVASFQGVDMQALAPSLSVLARDHLAPEPLRVRSRQYQNMQLTTDINRVAAMKKMPSLIKAYLRLGGVVGDGAFLDHAFNTTDVFLILDTAAMNDRQKAIYGGKT